MYIGLKVRESSYRRRSRRSVPFAEEHAEGFYIARRVSPRLHHPNSDSAKETPDSARDSSARKLSSVGQHAAEGGKLAAPRSARGERSEGVSGERGERVPGVGESGDQGHGEDGASGSVKGAEIERKGAGPPNAGTAKPVVRALPCSTFGGCWDVRTCLFPLEFLRKMHALFCWR
jgi:hypothetical protein